jgi:hypothetical protein
MPEAFDSPIRQTLQGHAESLPQEVVANPTQIAIGLIPKAQRFFLTPFSVVAQTSLPGKV